MTDTGDVDRRSLLRLLSTIGIAGLAGCSRSADTTTSPSAGSSNTPTRTTPANSTATRSENTETAADENPPTLSEFSARSWPGESIDSRALYLSGTAEDTSGIESVHASLETGQSNLEEFDGPETADFEISVPLEGGRAYTGTLEVEDSSSRGNTQSREFTTAQIPDEEPALTHDKLVGAHYYSWYGPDRHWPQGYAYTPTLGEYDSTDTHIIDQHIQWARQRGINWFSASWWGPEDQTGEVLSDRLAAANLEDVIEFSILYESYRLTGVEDDGDLEDPERRDRFRSDMQYLEETYFGRDNYLTIEGRPVVYLYSVNSLTGDLVGLLEEVKDTLETPPYFIADIVAAVPPTDWHLNRFEALDAITAYNPYGLRNDDSRGSFQPFIDLVEDIYLQWYLTAQSFETAFIPTVIPGYDKTENEQGGPNELLPRSTEAFTDFNRRIRGLMTPNLDAVLITSFNEWHEGTTLEPATEYGSRYLDVVADELATPEPDYWGEEYVPLEFEFNRTVVPAESEAIDAADDRNLAIRLYTLTFVGADGDVLAEYEVGVDGNEPVFAFGAFGQAYQASRDPSRWRWLGGPRETTRLFADPAVANAAELRLTASPIVDDDISATVAFDGREVGRIQFDQELEYQLRLS